MEGSPLRRTLVALGLAAAALGVTAPPAGAHALLASSDPADGALLDAPPAEIVLTFTEAPDRSLSRIEVLDAQGVPVETGEAEPVPGDPETLRVPVGDLPDGVYTVSWRVLSTVDGHVTTGVFAFGVGVASVGEAATGQDVVQARPPSPLAVAGRWTLYWGLALLLGAALAALLFFERGWRPASWLLLGAAAAVVLGPLALLVAEAETVGATMADLLGSERGRILLLRTAGVGAAAATATFLAARPNRGTAAALAIAAAAAMLIQAYAGHAGGATTMRWVKVGIQWVHIVGAAVWVGGLAWLLVGTRRREGPPVWFAVRRFSTVAGFGVAAVAATGFLRALDEVGSVSNLAGTRFGWTVLGKGALFLPMLALGAYNRYRNVRRIEMPGRTRILRRTVAGEVALAAGILGITGVMAGLVPPTQADVARPEEPEHVAATGSDFGTTVRVSLVAAPGTPGPNRFELEIADYDTGEPVQARQVSLRFSLPERPDVAASALDLDLDRDGVWTGEGVNLSVAGTWRVGVLIEQEADSLEVPLEVRTRQPEQRVIASEIPGEPTVYTIEIGDGRSVQAYVEPGEPGANEVHFTFFDPGGREEEIAEIRIEAEGPGGARAMPEPRRLEAGHFVATVELVPGTWVFGVEATTDDGIVVAARFEEGIEG